MHGNFIGNGKNKLCSGAQFGGVVTSIVASVLIGNEEVLAILPVFVI